MFKKTLLVLLFLVLLAGNIGLGFLVVNNVYATNRANQAQQVNVKILAFTKLFVEKILMSNQEVDFDTRLTLETMVRNLGDQDILAQWQRFTQAQDSQSASIEAKNLLDLLITKITY